MATVGGADRSGHDDLRRVMLPQRADRGLHRRAGRQAIVDHNHCPAAQRRLRTIAVVRLVAPFELDLLASDDLIHHRWWDAKGRNIVLAQHPHATGGNCADGELGLSWGPKLSYEEDIERCAKGLRDLEGDRDPTARECEDDDVVPIGVAGQCLGEPLSSLMPIAKWCIRHMVLLNGRFQCNRRSSRAGGSKLARISAHVSHWSRLMNVTTPSPTSRPVRIDTAGVSLNGDLSIPDNAVGLVVFVHGSGSSRFSQRNRAVADALIHAQLGTLLLDLLTEAEERTDAVTSEFRFDIPLLAERTSGVVDWVTGAPRIASLPLGLFGASTGAAAALIAAAERPHAVRAVVSRGGRPDLAEAALESVTAPTLLIVGGRDEPVIELNRRALDRLSGERELHIVPGATHLFEEPGALQNVARLATNWFLDHFV
jgi:putative phosphoribosyl transferase